MLERIIRLSLQNRLLVCLLAVVLVAGWLLGGTVGVGTVVFALAMGPLVQFFMARLSLHPVPERA